MYGLENINDHSKINSLQKEKCILAGSPESYPDESLKIGIALQTKGKQPVTGMRAHPENGTAGWYIWAGEYSEDPDFFKPIHIGHVPDVWPALMPYLALAPGYRFIIDNEGCEDIWHEPVITKK
ncbi:MULTISPECIES: immunity protein Imm33 domain-containing protein [unclassified Delftia]|uniref:immunity protein Imm33 domain-containing protein n=1 Tax=unclassified Delftia TaxID=2613839 RepID=UPI0018FF53FB|nr:MULTISPECIES: hypothetical protein [unclassified Delftia]